MKKTTILVTALIALFMAVGCKGNTPESVVNDFYTATQQNDYAKAMTFTTSSPKMSEVTIQILENMGMVIHHFEVINTDIEDGDSLALVTLHICSSNAKHPDSISRDIIVPCKKIKNDWKVDIPQWIQ